MKPELTIAEYSRLLGDLYGGHIEEDPYSNFLDTLREIMACNFASMTLREPTGDDGGLLFVSNDLLQKTFIDDHNNPYTDQYYTSNLMVNLPWGKVKTLNQLTSYSSLESTELYKICMEPINIYHMMGVDLRNANGQRFSVRLARPKEAPNFDQQDIDFFEDLSTHIQRAVANGVQLIQMDQERKLFAKTISGRSIGTITLDERGKVISCNISANDFINNKDGISIVNEQIYLQSSASRERLQEYIDEVIAAHRRKEQPPVYAMSVDRSSGKAPYELLIKPISIDKTVESARTPNIMVFISDPERKFEIDIKMLMSLYSLTRSEALLAKNLAAGYSLDQSATNLGIARNTARAQLRSIFSKTGVTQQSILVSLILKSLATLS